jgi:hypothetical protein
MIFAPSEASLNAVLLPIPLPVLPVISAVLPSSSIETITYIILAEI